MAYTAEQRRMISLALRLSGNQPAKVRRALLEAMAVESNFRNLNYGDRDSQGVLQQRPSQGWGQPGNAAQDIRQFLERASRAYAGGFRGTAGQLAQAVQRSAFPGRYDQRRAEVNRLLGRTSPSGVPHVNDYTTEFPDPSEEERDAKQGFLGAVLRNEENLVPSIMALKAAREAGKSVDWKWDGNDEDPDDGDMGNLQGKGALAQLLGLAGQFGVTATSTKRSPAANAATGGAPQSWHLKGRAVDYGGNTAKLMRLMNYALKHPGQFKEAFYDPAGYYVKNGKVYKGSIGGHGDHVHLAR